jgi:hypothetical protein
MDIRIELLSPTHMFLGIRFSINKLVDSLKGYDKDKEYPNVYLFEIGLLFIDIVIQKKGRK